MRVLFCLFLLFTSVSTAYADELEQGNLMSPSAKDILDQIEGRDMEASVSGGELTLNFGAGETDISDNQKSKIIDMIAAPYSSGRVKIISYATNVVGSDQSARRISLERAIKIREFLKAKHIPHTHIDLFPMGDKSNAGETNSATIYINAE